MDFKGNQYCDHTKCDFFYCRQNHECLLKTIDNRKSARDENGELSLTTIACRMIQADDRGKKYSPKPKPKPVFQRPVCWLCGVKILHKAEFTRDHVFPRALGGRDVEWNLHPAHMICNQIKGHMDPYSEEFHEQFPRANQQVLKKVQSKL